jgi:F0F1-type ATP synthase assembly protein I
VKERTGPKAPRLTTIQALTVASQFGVTLSVSVALGLFAGQWLDGQLGTTVVFTFIGVFLGLGTSCVSMVRTYRVLLRRIENEEQRQATTTAEDLANGDHFER